MAGKDESEKTPPLISYEAFGWAQAAVLVSPVPDVARLAALVALTKAALDQYEAFWWDDKGRWVSEKRKDQALQALGIQRRRERAWKNGLLDVPPDERRRLHAALHAAKDAVDRAEEALEVWSDDDQRRFDEAFGPFRDDDDRWRARDELMRHLEDIGDILDGLDENFFYLALRDSQPPSLQKVGAQYVPPSDPQSVDD